MSVITDLKTWDKWDYANWGKNRLIFMAGRVLLSIALGSVAFAGASLPFIGLFAVGLTALLQGVIIWRDQGQHEQRLMQDYRNEIASKLNLSPAQVTIRDMHTVANGDPEMGLQGNPVLKEAISRNGTRQMAQLSTILLSALTILGAFVLLPDLVKAATEAYGSVLRGLTGGMLGKVDGAFWRPVGAMLASGFGMSILSNAYDFVAERMVGLNHRSAGSYIREIDYDLSKGKDVSYEQVFSVFVAADKVLANSIQHEYGRLYDDLKPTEQAQALLKYGKHYPIVELTKDLNAHQIEANELAFAAVGQKSGVPRKVEPQYMKQSDVAHRVRPGLKIDIATDVAPNAAALPPRADAANDNRTGTFVEKLTGHTQRDPELTHVQQLELRRHLSVLDTEPKR